MKYAGIIKNDVVNGSGICVSFWTQGCPHRCIGCHNPETWDQNNGKDFTSATLNTVLESINANGIHRNFSILGGEPLAEYNLPLIAQLIKAVRQDNPAIKIFLWTGYTFEELRQNQQIMDILINVDILVDGRYEQEKRDISLPLRGSINQRVLDCKKSIIAGEPINYDL